jgi:cell division protein FtsB
MKKWIVLILASTIALSGCGKSAEKESLQKDISKLEKENKELKQQKEKLSKQQDKLKRSSRPTRKGY